MMLNLKKRMPSDLSLYAGITVAVIGLTLIQNHYPTGSDIIFVIVFVMIFFLASEVFGRIAGIYTAIISVVAQLLNSIHLKGQDLRMQIFATSLLATLIIYYYLVGRLRKRKFEITSESEKYFRSLVNIRLQPIILKDKTGRVLFASESVNKLLGPNAGLEPGKYFSDLVHPDDLGIHSDFFQQILNKPKQIISAELRIKKNDKWIWIKNEGINLLNHSRINAIVTSLQDITIQKEIDSQKSQLLENEKKARSDAEKAIKDRDEFLSIASHELKTPLTTILLQLQATLRKISTQSLSDFSGSELLNSLSIAEKQSQNLSRLVKDLLNVSLASTGRLALNKESVNLSKLAESLFQKYDEEIKLSHCNVELIIKNREIIGSWDPVRLEQAMTNIFLNALKYAKGKKIKLICERYDNFGVFTVSDRGNGIPKDKLENIFDPFNNSNNDPGVRGLGVGLFISRQIAVAHKGTILVESQIGKGASFSLKLPLIKEDGKHHVLKII